MDEKEFGSIKGWFAGRLPDGWFTGSEVTLEDDQIVVLGTLPELKNVGSTPEEKEGAAAGRIARFDPESGQWQVWKLPGSDPQPYAIYVDEHDKVWVSDWGANAIVRFDPASGQFTAFPSPRRRPDIRQMLGRAGEVWAAESGTDHLVRIGTGS